MEKTIAYPMRASAYPKKSQTLNNIFSFFRSVPTSYWMIVVLVIAVFLRLWNVSQNVMFEGDQGRDALIASRIFREGDIVLIGPVMSVGNIYLGPLYYYFMVPFLWLSYPSPLGPVYGVIGFGILTVWLVYKLGKEIVGEKPALVAALLYALASNVANNVRFSWNPNLTPFVSLLVVYWTYKAWTQNKWYWAGVIGAFAVMVQLHYFNILSAFGFGVIWIMQLSELIRTFLKKESGSSSTVHKELAAGIRTQILATVCGVIIFLATLTPILAFDLRHDWLNTRAFWSILHEGDNFIASKTSATLGQKITKTLFEMHGRSMHILFEMNFSKIRILNTVLVVLVMFLLITKTRLSKHKGLILLSIFLITSIVGTSFYQHSVFDHHLGYMYPVAALILGWCLTVVWQKKFIGPALVLVFMWQYVGFNVPRYQLQPGNNKLSDIQLVTDTILNRVDAGEKYNIVLLSGTGDIDGMKYRYFLEASSKPPVMPENRGEVEKLFIINADRKLKKVVDSPVYEIVVFPDKNPLEVYEIPGGPEVTVLQKKR